MFRTWGALKSHLIGSAHRCLTVVCPWCPGKEKTFTRISDLESHVRGSAHTDEAWRSKEMFSRQAGFYFALKPIDYAKVTESVTPYGSELAYSIRKEFRNWAEGFDDKKERLDRLNKGWKEGEECSKKKDRRGRSVSSERPGRITNRKEEKSCNSGRGKRYTDCIENDINKKQKTLEKVDKEHKSLEKDANNNKQRALDVDRQEKMDTDMNKTKDKVEKESITERGDAEQRQKTEDFYEYEFDCEVAEERNETEAAVNTLLGEMKDTEKGRVGPEEDGNCLTIGENVDISMRLNYRTGEFLPILDSDDLEKELNTGTYVKSKDSIGDGIRGDVLGSTENESSIKEDKQDKGVSARGSIRGIKVGHGSPENEDSFSTSSSSSGSSSVSEVNDSPSTLGSRAAKLLLTGVMPLCPPGRRIWSREIEIDVGDVQMKWPPRNWRELTPENRLFAMEQMALFLERKNNVEFPVISKKLLCDKYAFLMLDGQDKPLASTSECEKIPDKIRQYNLSYLKGIIKGEIPDSQQAWAIVKSLEKAERWTETDDIIKVLEEGGVKVKL
jgi:hypothetical protein